jgi:hypothetical protein
MRLISPFAALQALDKLATLKAGMPHRRQQKK